jgi:hypothetical protein
MHLNSIPVSYFNRLVFNYLSATLHRGDSTATTLLPFFWSFQKYVIYLQKVLYKWKR